MPLRLKPVSSHSAKGQRPYQEDRLFIGTYEQGTLIGVFDGHGGNEVSEIAVGSVPGFFADEIGEPKATARTALKKTIAKVHKLTEHYGSGSTLSLAWIPNKGKIVYCAVIGDSPIIVKDSKGAINISPDHNVRTNETEAQAVRDRGGFVVDGYAYDNRFGVGLQMARALGDSDLRRVLSRKPDIYSVRIDKDSFVIVATDGAFDPGHYDFKVAAEAVVKLVEEGAEAKAIVDRAVTLKTGDNVSALVARFEKAVPKKASPPPDETE